ncbi:MAG: hypothetical protein AAF609_15275 [Cyanobacteria bacterium P01_C01_bin.120]
MQVTSDYSSHDSVGVLQSFCRMMLQTSLLAIPVYLGLFMIAVPFDIDAGRVKGMALTLPVVLFLLAAAAYAIGFLATLSDAKRESFEVLMSNRRHLVRFKTKFIVIGAGLFSLGVTSGTLLLIKAHL